MDDVVKQKDLWIGEGFDNVAVDRLQEAALVSTSGANALLYLSRVVVRRHSLSHLIGCVLTFNLTRNKTNSKNFLFFVMRPTIY